jgi:methylphosphotriester-DNA--protein-cysteine methyltransferase
MAISGAYALLNDYEVFMEQPPTAASLEQLRQQLHEANERHHAARQEWEKWLDASEYRHEERIGHARAALEQAEQAVEAVEAEIGKAMRGQAT